MAGAKGAGAGCGCGALGLLVLVAMCTGGSDGGSGSSYSPSAYTAPASAPAPAYTPAAEQEPREWLYVHGPMNVRAEPGTDARIVRTLSRGDRVQVGPADANGWARVYDGGEADAYVYRASDLVRTDPPDAPRSLSGPSGGGSRRSGGGRQLHVGPRGGCYYYNSSGNKQYVDRSECY